MDKRAIIRAAAKLPRMTDEEVGFHMKAINRKIARQQMFDAMLKEAKDG